MNRIYIVIMFLIFAAAAGCSKKSPASGQDQVSGGGFPSEYGTGVLDGGGGGSPGGGGSGGSEVQPGQITAGDWDDRADQSFLTALFDKLLQDNPTLSAFKVTDPPPVASFASQKLQISLVMDTTGSMGDEMAYLKAETADIFGGLPAIQSLQTSLVAYRDVDQGDEYVTRVFPFTSVLPDFLNNLKAQSAGGGGDYEESMQLGLKEMVNLQWSTDPTVKKIAFLIADAPPHAQDMAEAAKWVQAARDKGIRIFPIAASGADQVTEALMRSAAFQTGGRYIFITNDSGIGGGHIEPDVGCYKVEYLNNLLKRIIQSEIDGAYIPVADADVLRVSQSCGTAQ